LCSQTAASLIADSIAASAYAMLDLASLLL
jgi:hypothetical protein